MRKQLALVLLLILGSFAGYTQQKVTGFVEDDETGISVAFASVTAEKGGGAMTDSSGKFALMIRKSRLNDSIIISAIGYSSKKIAIRDLLGNNKVKLVQSDRTLEDVKVYASLKGDYRQFGYYREFHVDTLTWVQKIDSARYRRNYRGNGEIGYIFDMPEKKFHIGKDR